MTIRLPRVSRAATLKTAMASAIVVAGFILSGSINHAQSLSYTKGQPVAPAFEGWENGPDGTFLMVFGYMNENWEEELDIPIGPDNNFDQLGADQGQPTRFLPRRNRFIFKVKVPKDFGNKELVWTLTSRGVTKKAWASLRQDYFIDNVVVASETGALGAGSSNPTLRANKTPIVQIQGEKKVNAKVGEKLPLSVLVTDDGVPKAPGQGNPMPNETQLARRMNIAPYRPTVAKMLGLHQKWFVYRAPVGAKVVFDPPQVKAWEDTRTGANSPWAPVWIAPPLPADNKWQANVTFDTPGTYLLRSRADDGLATGDDELTVTVGR